MQIDDYRKYKAETWLAFYFSFFCSRSESVQNLRPLVTDHPNETVYLEGCTSEECAFKGHLTQQIFTGHYVLSKEDGRQLIFSPRLTLL